MAKFLYRVELVEYKADNGSIYNLDHGEGDYILVNTAFNGCEDIKVTFMSNKLETKAWMKPPHSNFGVTK